MKAKIGKAILEECQWQKVVEDQAVVYRRYMQDGRAHRENLSFAEWKKSRGYL